MFVNENIKRTERVFPMQGRYGYLRYDMNENPEGLPEDFVKSVLKEITPEFLAIYPEPDRFLCKYAESLNIDFENVMATNGSDTAIRYLLETFGEPGKDVVTVSPSFEMYWVNCNILGLHHVPVSYESDLTISIDKITAAITENTRVVVLLNPNNPVGNVYTQEEAEAVIRKADKVGAIVIIDEAYHYFYDKTFINLIKKFKNVAVLRTFSKLYSIAACRLGVIIGSPDIIRYAKKAKLTFDVNSIALLFGERLLDHPEIREQLIQKEKAGKKYILEKLHENGYNCEDCRGNFIFVQPKKNPKEIEKYLREEKHILVKSFSNELLKTYLRISTGSVKAMDAFLQAFLQADR